MKIFAIMKENLIEGVIIPKKLLGTLINGVTVLTIIEAKGFIERTARSHLKAMRDNKGAKYISLYDMAEHYGQTYLELIEEFNSREISNRKH